MCERTSAARLRSSRAVAQGDARIPRLPVRVKLKHSALVLDADAVHVALRGLEPAERCTQCLQPTHDADIATARMAQQPGAALDLVNLDPEQKPDYLPLPAAFVISTPMAYSRSHWLPAAR